MFRRRRSRTRRAKLPSRRNQRLRRLALEALEDRRLLAVVEVNTSSDELDGDFSSIAALIANPGTDGVISLREAILAANGTPNDGGPDEIHFAIPGAGVQTIVPFGFGFGVGLPAVQEAVIIDAFTQSGAAANSNPTTQAINATPLVLLDGSFTLPDENGIVIAATASGTTIRGLIIQNFSGSGILVDGADDNIIVGNFLGTNATGTMGFGNAAGVTVLMGSNNRIGGTAAADRNLISGNAAGVVIDDNSDGNLVLGNFIGTTAGGDAALGNSSGGVLVQGGSGENVIGGTAIEARNLISANTAGVEIRDAMSDGNRVHGNLIGTSVNGQDDLGNSGAGVLVADGAVNNLIGGTDAGAGNTLAFNDDGVAIEGAATLRNKIQRNSMFSNDNLGIDLANDGATLDDVVPPADDDEGPNRLQNRPTFVGGATLMGDSIMLTYRVDTDPSNATYPLTVEFFFADASLNRQGQSYFASDVCAAMEAGTDKLIMLSAPGGFSSPQIVATVTDADGNTSEFSASVSISGRVSLDGGNLVIDGATGDAADRITLRVDGDDLVIEDPAGGLATIIPGATGGGTVLRVPRSAITANKVIVNGLGGNDSLTVQSSVTAAGLAVDFFGSEGSDALAVIGSGTETATYTPGAPGSGVVDVGGVDITFSELEPVDISGMLNATLTLPGDDDVLTLENGFDFAAGGTTPAMRVSGTSGGAAIETVAFYDNETVTIDTTSTDGDDTITITSADNAHLNENLVISTGVGLDKIDVMGNLTVTGDVTIESQEIRLTGKITANEFDGRVTLNAGDNAIIDAAANDAVKIAAFEAVLTADDGIGDANAIDTAVFRMDIFHMTSNAVQINNTGALDLTVLEGVFAVTSDSNVHIVASSPLTISGDVSVGGSSSFTATDSAGPFDDINILSGVDITMSGALATLTFNAGDNFLFPNSATITTTGLFSDVVINVDTPDAPDDPDVGSSVMFLGTIDSGVVTINGGDDNDTFTIVPSVNTEIEVNGNAPPPATPHAPIPPGDRLIVPLAGIVDADLSMATLPDGMITFSLGSHEKINYTSIEGLVALSPDEFEDNDTLATATVLGSEETVTLRDLSIHDQDDVDFFRYTAHDTGKLIVRSLFDSLIGNLDLEVLDRNGNSIFISQGGGDEEEIIIPVVSQEVYIIRVYGNAGAVNNYSLEIENFPAPVPTFVDLVAASDTGRLNNDNLTSDNTPTFRIQADLVDFRNMGIDLLDQAVIDLNNDGSADDATLSGAGVFVTLVNFETGDTVSGFANQVGMGGVLWAFTPTLPLLDGEYFVSAAVQVVDFTQPERNTGRTQLSPPLTVTIDTLKPNVFFGESASGIDGLDPTSDTGVPSQPATIVDRITSDSSPTFWGTAEANATVRVYVRNAAGMRVLIGETVATPFVGNNPLASGRWSLTSTIDMNDPLLGFAALDGLREFVIEAEDVSGNLSSGAAITFQGPAMIPDDNTVEFMLPVSNLARLISDLNVTLNILHGWDPDLDIELESPNGTIVELFSDVGLDDDDNFINTTLDDEATTSINAGVAPFNGRFQPEGFLSMFDTENPNGTWILRVTDDELFIDGLLINWTLCFEETFEIFVDTQGPRVADVGNGAFDLLEPKTGPTPPLDQITIKFTDQPARTDEFQYPAVNEIQALVPGNYRLVGDRVGIVPIVDVLYTDMTLPGMPGMTEVTLVFAGVLPDDRYTLTIFDNLRDDAGNRLDGEFFGDPNPLPSGDGVPGGDFVAQFTVDALPELGVWAAGTVLIDANGNFISDGGFSGGDLAFHLGFSSDYIFAGNFAAPGSAADGFDKLAAYGRVGNQFRWLVDFTNDGVPDAAFNESAINGVPIAGNFDGNAANGDEFGLFTGTTWYFDTDHDFTVGDNSSFAAAYQGFAIAGDFDGDGDDDVATYIASLTGGNLFSIDLNTAGAGMPISIDGVADFTFRVGIAGLGAPAGFNGFPGVRERPVAADMNGDGVDDIGLWVPDGSALVPGDQGEWFFLVSGDVPSTMPVEVSVIDRISSGFVSFTPIPFGNDIYAEFGNSFALPVVGNFDPPPAQLAASLAAPSSAPANSAQSENSAPSTTNSATSHAAAAIALAAAGTANSTVSNQAAATPTGSPLVAAALVTTSPSATTLASTATAIAAKKKKGANRDIAATTSPAVVSTPPVVVQTAASNVTTKPAVTPATPVNQTPAAIVTPPIAAQPVAVSGAPGATTSKPAKTATSSVANGLSQPAPVAHSVAAASPAISSAASVAKAKKGANAAIAPPATALPPAAVDAVFATSGIPNGTATSRLSADDIADGKQNKADVDAALRELFAA
jgi:subtilisin-like proprotein convertase family protein